MNEWFFESADAVQRLRASFAKWRGTPFRQDGKALGPGGGIDCVGLVEECLGREAGVDRGEPFTFPRTPADYQSHRTELRVLKYLRGQYPDDPQSARLSRLFAELRLPKSRVNIHLAIFMPGDLVVFRSKGQFHLGIMLTPPRLMNCAFPLGVSEGNIHDTTFAQHVDALFRARAQA